MSIMRTTLEIEDDVLLAAKELARSGRTTAGRVISDLVRQALTQPAARTANSAREPAAVYGFRPFPSRGSVVTNEQVDKLRDEEGA
ncbi:MAG: hypothetical protein Q8O52_29200 [Sulfuritalea sp.]|nr:hypothetical protein [Sulfuritalea sp.]